MARRFSGIHGRITDPAVAEEYENAERFDKVRVGKTGVFFPYNLSIKYIPYKYMERAFIRINEVNGRMCCGKATGMPMYPVSSLTLRISAHACVFIFL